jgi:biopolymer transport protein ExbD
MQVKSTRTTKKARIEIIPLIDVIMFLLATFVLFTLTMTKTMNITMKLPEASGPPPPGSNPPKPNRVGIDNGGAFFWNKEQITWDDLLIKLSTLKQVEADPIVLIEGERNAEFGKAVQVLDEARKALGNAAKISIDTKAKETVR